MYLAVHFMNFISVAAIQVLSFALIKVMVILGFIDIYFQSFVFLGF
jgi:hypothetical protein